MNNRKTTKRNRVKNRNWREATLRLLQAWLRGWTRASEERFEPGHCRIVITSCVFFFFTLNVSNSCYFCLLQLPPTLSPNPQRRIVEQFKRALFSPQNSYFVNLKSEVKKVSLFSPSKCFATLGLQKGYSLITDWMATTYLYFSICAFQDQVVTNFWFHNITA